MRCTLLSTLCPLLLTVAVTAFADPPGKLPNPGQSDFGFARVNLPRESTSPALNPQSSAELLDLIDRRILEYTTSQSDSAQEPGRVAGDASDEMKNRESESAQVREGATAFESRCTVCHDASRSLNQSKALGRWRSTVRRMADKPGADIPPNEVEPIAAYLASRSNPPGQTDAPDAGTSPAGAASDAFSLFGTISPSWRGGHRGDVLENGGFLAQTWIGVEWRPSGPLRARASACISCHRGREPGTPVELAEATVTLDLMQLVSRDCTSCDRTNSSLELEAGRFIVPFGTIAERSHPGALRTVTPPLIFNMGQNVYRGDIGEVVLPMPYSDEGVRVIGGFQFTDSLNATADFYVVNGLHGGNGGVDFYNSRQYLDNNAEPAVGGRVTMGSRALRFGASVMSGRHNPEGPGAGDRSLNYKMAGVDAVWRLDKLLRVQAEYALRNTDYVLTGARVDEEVGGWAVEAEVLLCENPDLSFIARWDILNRRSQRVPPGSRLTDPRFAVERFTWGFNFGLPGGSHLMFNVEHWSMPELLSQVDVAGVRWVATF
ncbi:MAG: hypothetical protein O3A00_19385 [Planctomycetota bacterium]|nr:hypothetical protein [Planctomycetota bacterium]